METTKVISINTVGETTGRMYDGSFTVKVLMSQNDEFKADLRRRQLLGPCPEGIQPAANLQWKAFMLGQIFARSLDVPQFWAESNHGMDLYDANIATEVYDAILAAEEEFKEAVAKDSEKALEKLKKNAKKDETEE